MNYTASSATILYITLYLHVGRTLAALPFIPRVGTRFGLTFSTMLAKSNSSVWKEHITKSDGVIIQRAGQPVTGARHNRYEPNTKPNLTVLIFKRIQMDDGGYYSYEDASITGHTELVVVGDISCNVTGPHTRTDGDTIIYSCFFKYQGRLIPSLLWRGQGVTSNSIVNTSTKTDVIPAKPGTCYKGNCTTSVTIRATPKLNRTQRTATIYDSVLNTNTFEFITGKLIVHCKHGLGGPNCTQHISNHTCNTDPCKNGAVCTDSTGEIKCHCPARYTGAQCNVPIQCSSVSCRHGGTCVDDPSATFRCLCSPGFSGTYCEVAPTTVHEKRPAQSTTVKTPASAKRSKSWYRYLYLLIPLAVVTGGILIVCFVRRKRRARQDEGQMLHHRNAGKKPGKKAGVKENEEGRGLFRRIIPGF